MSTQSTRGNVACQCLHCGAEFRTWQAEIKKGGGRFCSHACYTTNRKANTARQESPCPTCGKMVETLASRAKRGWGVYCSNECRSAGSVTQVEVVCVTCKKPFSVVASRIGRVQTCSKACHNAHLRTLPIPTVEERFWEKVEKVGECWHWTGAKTETGYGVLAKTKRARNTKEGGQVHLAHRVSYELHNGPAAGLHVCHRCDNTICVNPVHLFLGTHADNMHDKTVKGRAAKKLTLDDAREIRTRYANSEATQRGLASEFGVSLSTIVNVLRRKTFKHVN